MIGSILKSLTSKVDNKKTHAGAVQIAIAGAIYAALAAKGIPIPEELIVMVVTYLTGWMISAARSAFQKLIDARKAGAKEKIKAAVERTLKKVYDKDAVLTLEDMNELIEDSMGDS